MEELVSKLPNPMWLALGVLAWVAFAVYIYRQALEPLWRLVTHRVHKADQGAVLAAFAEYWGSVERVEQAKESWEVLEATAAFLKPNGKPLAEHLRVNEEAHEMIFRRFTDIAEALDSIGGLVATVQQGVLDNSAKIDAIVKARNGGQRSYDPQ